MPKEIPQKDQDSLQKSEISLPEEVAIIGQRAFILRYGENPHQQAAVYFEPNSHSPLKNLQRISGRELSLVNLTDIHAGIESVRIFDLPTTAIIKHNTPCGIALGSTTAESLSRAIESDPESAFGGVVVSNRIIDVETARIVAKFKADGKGNFDIIAAPTIDADAAELLRATRKTLGIYALGDIPKASQRRNTRWIDGGFIVQTSDDDIENGFAGWEVVTDAKPTEEQLQQMKVAWKFLTRIKSNAVIVVDKEIPIVRGIGTGQTSRVRSTRIALEQAGTNTQGGILASDSFFPFGDSVMLASEHGIGAIVQQGDSINDKASIEAANEAGIPMVFTHRRAFWH